MTLLAEAGRLWLDVTAEVPITEYSPGTGPDPAHIAGVDLGVIHPYAVAGPDGQGLLVSGRAIRAEHRMHLADTKAAAGRSAVGRRRRGSGGRGAGARPAAGPGRWKTGTAAASTRPNTRPPPWSSAGL